MASTEATPSAPTQAAAVAARKDTTKQRDESAVATSTAAKSKSTSTAKTATAARTTTQRSSASADQAPDLAPEDPYRPPDTQREIEALATRSQAAFSRCEGHFGPARGAIQIAFQVRGDGRVIHAAAVENSTGNTDLANCLVAVVSSWRVSAHHGDPINMVRPFNYP